jgi:hypothetical protein
MASPSQPRPADKNGLGLKQAEAVANVRAFGTRASLLTEDSKVADCLLGLLESWRLCSYTASVP